MLKEFREFALRGNVVDMAIGIVIGGAFGTIVSGFVNHVLMPPIGLLVGNVEFSDLFWLLRPGPDAAPPYSTLAAAQEAGAVTLNYGLFINSVISFLIIALAMFFLVRAMNRMARREPEPAGPPPRHCPFCALEIPDEASRCPHCTSQLEATG